MNSSTEEPIGTAAAPTLATVAQPNPDIPRALAQIRARARDYERYDKYWRGDHRLSFASQKFREAFGGLFHALSDNLCPAPIDALADRMEVEAFSVEEGGNEAAGEEAWKLWEANRMDRRAGEVHQEAFKGGDAYVIVWPDKDNTPRILPQPAEIMTVCYDPEQPGVVMWAAKCWTDGDDSRTYLTMYYPDRIEKYVTRQNSVVKNADGTPSQATTPTNLDARSFERRVVVDENGNQEPWPLPNQYGTVPVFHFANNAGVGRFGISELKNVTPLQDALNKSVADMLVAMEYVAYPQRWATGIQVDIDENTGLPLNPFNPGPGSVYTSGNETARFGDFSTSDLSQYLKVSDSFRLEIARVTATPLHYMALMTDPPSGEALKTLEARFVKKCLDRQTAFGNVWEDVMALALRMQGGADVRLQTEWANPAPQSELEIADVGIQWKALGVPDYVIWERLGFTDADIKQWLAEKAAQQAKMQQQMADANAQAQAQAQMNMQAGQAGQPPAQGAASTSAMMKPMQSNGLPSVAEHLAQNVRVTPPKIGG